jgi:endo-1,4-beta-xylanase
MGTVASFYDFWLRWDDGRFLEVMRREYSMAMAPDFEWYFPGEERPLRPAPHVFDFTVNDAQVAFIESAGLKVRGHPLIHPSWNLNGDRHLPAWLKERSWTRSEATELLREHISTVVGRYRGRVKEWVVVNEAIQVDGTFMDCFWLRQLGPDYIEMALRFAHEADPDALLFLNEDGGEAIGNKNSDAFYALAKGLVSKGVPLHGVGLETHMDLQYRTVAGDQFIQSPEGIRANMLRLGALGLRVEITEMDLPIPMPPTQADLTAQGRIYSEVLAACLSVSACTGFSTWGFTDRYTYANVAFPGRGAALPFDAEFAPKPAYYAMRDLLARTPVDVVEFYNASLDHYFITRAPDEIEKLDAGKAIKGWARTGKTFGSYVLPQTASSPICRYYIPPILGDSHFFGRGTQECAATAQNNPSLVLEDPQFMQMFLPVSGVCPAGTSNVYRVFSNRPDANHRYMTDKADRTQMMAKGWLAEGDGPDLVVMCAPASNH